MPLLFVKIDTATGRKVAATGAATFHQETPTGSVDGTNDTFTLTTTPAQEAAVQIFVDGLIRPQDASDNGYSVDLQNKQITFNTPPSLGQDVYAFYSS